jgi:hypothetical protein
VDKLIIGVVWVDIKCGRACSEITFPKEVKGAIVIEEDPNSDIELPLINKERPLDILLENEAIMLKFVAVCVVIASRLIHLLARRFLLLCVSSCCLNCLEQRLK